MVGLEQLVSQETEEIKVQLDQQDLLAPLDQEAQVEKEETLE